jgi:transposase
MLGMHTTKYPTDLTDEEWQRLAKIWADGGYAGTLVAWVKALRPRGKLHLEIVKRSDDMRGFKVLPRRWVVERPFGCFIKQRRMVRDYETKTEHSGGALATRNNPEMNTRRVKPKSPGFVGKRTPSAGSLPFVLTIGHSTRTLEEFVGLLQAHGATLVVDVRTVPRSRHNPQFNKDSLPSSLKQAGLGYLHIPGLGGLRHAKHDSLNAAWRNASFRGYADYMQTPEFEQSLEELIRLTNQDRIALMCAEAVPWRCHRSLIADALLVRGIRAEDIMSQTSRQVHTLTPFAKVRGTILTYPANASPRNPKKPSAKRSGSHQSKIKAT